MPYIDSNIPQNIFYSAIKREFLRIASSSFCLNNFIPKVRKDIYKCYVLKETKLIILLKRYIHHAKNTTEDTKFVKISAQRCTCQFPQQKTKILPNNKRKQSKPKIRLQRIYPKIKMLRKILDIEFKDKSLLKVIRYYNPCQKLISIINSTENTVSIKLVNENNLSKEERNALTELNNNL